jgi:ATP-dependent helicase/nuclease subunit B
MSRGLPHLAAFPAAAAFLAALAHAWLAQPGDPAEGLIILPNRRAARALAAAFLPANHGKALLLPRIIAPGAIDEAGLALTGALSLPPAVPVLLRQSAIARLILAMNGANGAPRKLPGAWRLAADLAALLDEADEAEIDLAETLPNVVGAELAEHWQTTLKFLEIVTHVWPARLAELGMMNPAARQSALIDAQAEAWAARPPAARIWLVTAGANPALTRLAAVVAGLPNGAVILPGHDWNLNEAAWDQLDESHPAAGILHLLTALGASREEITLWPAPGNTAPGRVNLLSQALLPAGALESWQSQSAFDLSGIHRLSAADEQQEATAIAMALRDALETPGATTALITPDRGLATRVAATLKRFGITADDSAGENLTDTPPAIFLRLLSRAAAAEFAPLPLLALLKHPLTAAGEKPEHCRAQARALDRRGLRGPRPSPGFAGIKFNLEKPGTEALKGFVVRLELRLRPIAGLPVAIGPADALQALITAAEAMAATADSPGAARLWSGEAGAALAALLAEALPVLDAQPAIAPADLPDLLDALLEGHVIRRPRSKDGHPRIAIWGVQEAMLQTVDTAILGGLVEGVWPSLPEPGPWLSRPMRKAAGLPSPERQIGAAAHEFFALGSGCKTVIFSAPTRRDRAPAVPARWLTRLDALLAATGQSLDPHPAAAWAAQLDTPALRIQRPKPAPRPASHLRPTTLSISDIATLIADPYAIYARHILRISQLDPLDEESDPSLFGNIVHKGLQNFFAVGRNFDAPDAAAELTLALQIAMRGERPRAALENWWAARLERIAGWIIDAERERRINNPPVAMALEIEGILPVAGGFTLKGRADRIEKRADGSVFIMDYKTGAPPDEKKVESGAAPQLPLEAVMAQAGAFGAALQGPVTELGFWKLSGRNTNGEDRPLFAKDPARLRQVIDTAAEKLPALFQKFALETTPYLARPHPSRSTYDDPYHGVSRRGEWGGEGSDDG